MIEESGVVISTRGDSAWVETTPRTSCGGCGEQSACGTNVLSTWFTRRAKNVQVENSLHVSTGDHVVIGINELALLRSAVMLYLLPLFGLILGGAAGEWLGHQGAYPQLFSIVGGIAGLVLTLLAVKAWLSRFSGQGIYQPVLLKRL